MAIEPSSTTALSIVVEAKAGALISAASRSDVNALTAIKEIKTRGLPTFITGCIDYTGSMHDDVVNVQTGISNWMRGYTRKLPSGITDQLGTDFLRITGATIKFRDVEYDGSESFEMGLFNNVRPETYIAKSTEAYDEREIRGGGGNYGESSLISLLLSYGLDRKNQAVDKLFMQLKTIMKESESYQGFNEEDSYEKLVKRYDRYTTYEHRPNLVYLVTDEPPKEQLGITPDLLAQMKPQGTQMVFFIRNYTKEWELVAEKLGATLIDLGEIDKASSELHVDKDDLIGQALTLSTLEPLLEALNNSLTKLLPEPKTAI